MSNRIIFFENDIVFNRIFDVQYNILFGRVVKRLVSFIIRQTGFNV